MGQPNLTPAQIAAENQAMLASESFQAKLAKTMPQVGITPQRYVRMIAAAFTMNPKLWACSRASITRALLFSAQTGLAPTGRGGIHLVPFKNRGVLEITPIIDYRGAMKIARRSGDVVRMDADAVYERDEFEYEKGASPRLVHRPFLGDDRGDLVAVYAVAHLRDAIDLPIFVVLSKHDVDQYKARSKARSNGPWVTDYAAMAKKTAVLRLCNLLPADDDDQRLLALASGADSHDGDSMLDAVVPPTANVAADVSDPSDEPDPPGGIDPETGEVEGDAPVSPFPDAPF